MPSIWVRSTPLRLARLVLQGSQNHQSQSQRIPIPYPYRYRRYPCNHLQFNQRTQHRHRRYPRGRYRRYPSPISLDSSHQHPPAHHHSCQLNGPMVPMVLPCWVLPGCQPNQLRQPKQRKMRSWEPSTGGFSGPLFFLGIRIWIWILY